MKLLSNPFGLSSHNMLRILAACTLLLLKSSEARHPCSCSCCRAELSRTNIEEGQESSFDTWQCTYAPALASSTSDCEDLCDVGGTTASFFRLLSTATVATDMQRFCFEACSPQLRRGGPSDPTDEVDDICGPLRPGQASSSFLTPHRRPTKSLLSASSTSSRKKKGLAARNEPKNVSSEEQLHLAEEILKLTEQTEGYAKEVETGVGAVRDLTKKVTDVLPTALVDVAKAKNAAMVANILELKIRGVLAEVKATTRREALAEIPTILAEERKKAEVKALEAAEKNLAAEKEKQWKETKAKADADAKAPSPATANAESSTNEGSAPTGLSNL